MMVLKPQRYGVWAGLIAGLLAGIVLQPAKLIAQPYGLEWVKPGQSYFKISLANDGIYRLGYAELQAAGVPLASVDPRKLRVYRRGEELAVWVEGQNDARFDPGDYLEFYGERNDGATDRELYADGGAAQPHPLHNLYSDTSAYFLTWDLLQNGRRMNRNLGEANTSGLPEEAFHLNQHLRLQVSDYSPGLHYPLGTAGAETVLSEYDFGEGWTGPSIRKGNFQDFTFTGMPVVASAPEKPRLAVLLAGRNNLRHRVIVEAGPNVAGLRSVREVEFNYRYNSLAEIGLEWADISAQGELLVRIRVAGFDDGQSDFVSVSYLRLILPETTNHFNQDEKKYYLAPNPGGKSFVRFTNVALDAWIYDITDPANVGRFRDFRSFTTYPVVVSNVQQGRKLFISRVINTPVIRRVTLRQIDPARHDYLIITHPVLRAPAGVYTDPPKSFAAYRASAAGGSYDTLLLNIQEVYDLFSYGEVSPLGIYRFVRYMVRNGDPKYLFLIGRGLTPNYNFHRRDFSQREFKDLVPTGGYPGSDLVFANRLLPSAYEPAISIGRLSALQPAHVTAYLNKVKEMEAQTYNALWKKDMIHLSGGRTAAEQQTFLRYVNSFERVAEGPYFGASVTTVSKTTNNATELINVSEQVNAGASMLTFFGHSGTGGTDIDIGYCSLDPMGYRNKGKYPCILVNGCNAGDTFVEFYGFGEDWIITPDRGAVAFIAHTGAGFTVQLRNYSDLFYKIAFADTAFTGSGIGDIQREVSRRYLATYFNNYLAFSQITQMTLQGDPAVKPNGASRPDYEIAAENIFTRSVDGQPISAFSERFLLGLIVRNYGMASEDSLRVMVRRKLSSGELLNPDTLSFPPVYYRDTLFVEVESVGATGFGNNQFTVKLDPGNEIGELNEMNNEAVADVFLPIGGTSNLYPREYALVANAQVKLSAQSLDLLIGERNFVFEIDTTAAFNSPARQSASIIARSLAHWTVNLNARFAASDSTVFYWRTRFADAGPEEINDWTVSSFTYIPGTSAGWSMSHRYQFQEVEGDELQHNLTANRWEFRKFNTRVVLKTFGPQHPEFNYEDVELFVENTSYIFQTRLCTDNSINLLAFDKSTTAPYLALNFGTIDVLDRRSCGRVPQVIRNFLKNEIESSLFIDKYIDEVRAGDYVLVFSIGTVTYESWPASTRAKLLQLGISESDINLLRNGYPVIFLGRKGAEPGTAIKVMPDLQSSVPPGEQELTLERDISGTLEQGSVSSPLIGPAYEWNSFSQHTRPSGTTPAAQYSFDVLGVDGDRNEEVLFSNQAGAELDLSQVDAGAYPYLKLNFKSSNDQALVPAQMRRWTVLYGETAEGVLMLADGQAAGGIEKKEGELQISRFRFDNVSDVPFRDSVAVEYIVFNQDQRLGSTDTLKIAPLNARESKDFEINLSTQGQKGGNDLRVFANPYIQPERSFNNNVLDLKEHFTVISDNLNPVMEVTVDGTFLMDGDIVSPSPLILMRMKDNNTALFKQDTAGIELYLKKPCEGCDFERISLSSENVVWTPATDKSDFTVEYRPEPLADGLHALRVQAEDVSGNKAGSEPYQVSFEVVNESQITHFYPYPNPFSTSTRFVFTLTGSEIPEDLIIQIMTVSGKVVREITRDEIGPIRIGTNITEYAWDGRDEYGDRLANGVYLYRVKVRLNGAEIKQRATSGDRAFKHGFGKIYLAR
jgi:hypothetical protein